MTSQTEVVGGPPAGSYAARAAENEGAGGGSDGGTLVRLSDRALLTAALALTLLPLLVSAIALVLKEGDHMPIGDYAQIELRVRDVGLHTPLTGLWSRESWNHPGPLGFVVLTPLYRLLGSPSIGLHLGALVVNGAALAGIGLLARRRGGTPLMLCTLGVCGLMVLNLGADYVRSPWNPYMPVLSYGLLILLAWTMACGEAWALPVAVVVGSFAAQTHVGFVALGAPLLIWGLACLAWRERDRLRVLVTPLLLGGTAALVLWLPPLADIVFNKKTNADAIRRYFTDPDHAALALADGWRVVAGQVSLEAEWLTGRQPTIIGRTAFLYSSPLPWLLVPLALAGVVLWRWNRPGDRALVATLLLAFGTAVVAVSRTIGQVADYRLQPTWWPAALAGAMALWVAWRAVQSRWPTAESRWMVPLTGTALVALAVVNSASAVRSEVKNTADSQIMARLTPDIVDAVGTGEGEVLVMDGSGRWSFYAEAIVLQLERHGIEAVVAPARINELRFGRNRIQEDDEPRATLVAVAFSDNLDRWADEPGLVPIATWSAEEKPIDAGRGPIIDRMTVFLEQ